jgi:hypothetical protein
LRAGFPNIMFVGLLLTAFFVENRWIQTCVAILFTVLTIWATLVHWTPAIW